jgi:hypothetical protein
VALSRQRDVFCQRRLPRFANRELQQAILAGGDIGEVAGIAGEGIFFVPLAPLLHNHWTRRSGPGIPGVESQTSKEEET